MDMEGRSDARRAKWNLSFSGRCIVVKHSGSAVSNVQLDRGIGNWLFGGIGFDSGETEASLNDLVEVQRRRVDMDGRLSVANQKGVYGTLGIANSNNFRAQNSAAIWKEASGDLWLFGGIGRMRPVRT